MLRFGRESAEGDFDLFGAECGDGACRFPFQPLGQGVAGGDGGGAAADQKARLGDCSILKSRRKLENIAAGGVGDFHRDGGRREASGMAGVLKMIDKFFAVQCETVCPLWAARPAAGRA